MKVTCEVSKKNRVRSTHHSVSVSKYCIWRGQTLIGDMDWARAESSPVSMKPNTSKVYPLTNLHLLKNFTGMQRHFVCKCLVSNFCSRSNSSSHMYSFALCSFIYKIQTFIIYHIKIQMMNFKSYSTLHFDNCMKTPYKIHFTY